jgi:hypothetical protein
LKFQPRPRYLPPAAPTLRSAPPRGEQWLHEVKFDGWRIQLHKPGGSAAAFTKNGHDHCKCHRAKRLGASHGLFQPHAGRQLSGTTAF